MTEELLYITVPYGKDRKIFVHIHRSKINEGKAILFLNPILDEKKRVQKFQAETARAICQLNYYVFRFDYYGNGDSQGELHEFDLHQTAEDIEFLVSYIEVTYKISSLKLLGIRLGADLAILAASHNMSVSDLFLIEPIVKGKRFLIEQRARRKSFYRLNNMSLVQDDIMLDSQKYEDFQGFPLSESVIEFIANINMDDYCLNGKRVFLFKVNLIFSKKTINSFIEKIASKNNEVYLENVNCLDFWASLEPTDTIVLTDRILKYL